MQQQGTTPNPHESTATPSSSALKSSSYAGVAHGEIPINDVTNPYEWQEDQGGMNQGQINMSVSKKEELDNKDILIAS